MDKNSIENYTTSFFEFNFVDRRKSSFSNRIRRSINSYWLVPVFVLYLELLTVLIPPIDSPLKNIEERNLYFLKGTAVMYNLVSTDFPYALIGHFKEVAIVKKYLLGIGQVPSQDIAIALTNKSEVQQLYSRIIASKAYLNTEVGGIVTISYDKDNPRLHLYEIPSINKSFSDRLKATAESSVSEFLALLQEEESIGILTRVEVDSEITKRLIEVLSTDSISYPIKDKLIKDFIRTYDLYSQLKYVLSPIVFKSFLGSTRIEGEYIGLFHFHNDYMEPPSEIDMANSYSDRQIIFTLSDDGIILYDAVRGTARTYQADLWTNASILLPHHI
ncbi:MAG: hypothetical protein IT392_01770 [Nitrospirae bacterium]|nr:hypothetical protein [Nitrospirota bacterium]